RDWFGQKCRDEALTLALAIERYEEERQAARTAPLRPSFRRDNRARIPLSPSAPGFWDDIMTSTATTIRLPHRLDGRAEECDPMELPQTGGCQCGAVRYEITQAPIIVYTCHCTDCQRMTSSAFSLGCVLPDGAFRLVQGEPKGVQRTTGSGRMSTRWVCPECGVWVCTAPSPGTTVRNVRGGTLDDTSLL